MAQRVVVLGGGVAGLSAALLMERDGHAVTLIERDPVVATSPQDAFSWERKGITHFLLPHAFLARGRKELREALPDVYDALIAAGAYDMDLRGRKPGGIPSRDPDLYFVGVRRPVIEWALRDAVLRSRVAVVPSTHVRGIDIAGGRVTGVRTDEVAIEADVVVDAMGRRSPTPAWVGPVEQEKSDCGVIYYARYYRVVPGKELPDGPWLLSPRGDLGYMAFASFPGDNGTFGALLAIPHTDHDLRAFKDETVFEAGIAAIPMIRSWANPDLAEPITGVLPMGGLQNTLNRYDAAPPPSGVFPIGDALCHTDPVMALGLSFSLIHARAVTESLREHADPFAAYMERVMPEVRERFDLATALDAQRLRMWTGELVDFAHRAGDHALFTVVAAGAAGLVDPDVFEVSARRVGFLDRTSVLDDDVAMQERIEKVFGEMMATPRPAPGPGREEMLKIVEAAG